MPLAEKYLEVGIEVPETVKCSSMLGGSKYQVTRFIAARISTEFNCLLGLVRVQKPGGTPLRSSEDTVYGTSRC